MSTSFPSHQQPPNGQYPTASPSYPQPYQQYGEPYSQGYVPAGYSAPSQVKPGFDPRQQMNGYSFPPMNATSQSQMMAGGMPPGQYGGAPQMRQYQQYVMQQPMMSQMVPGQPGIPNMAVNGNSQMGPHGMQMNGMGVMGPPMMNGNHTMMVQQQPQQRPPSQQMKSPMPGSAPLLQRSDSNSGKQMNSPGTFTAPLPRTKSNSTHSQHSPGIYPQQGQQAPVQTPPHPPQVSTPSSVPQQSSMPSPQQPHMVQMNNQIGGPTTPGGHMGNQNAPMTNNQNGAYPGHNNMMGGQMNNQPMKMEMSPMSNHAAHSSPLMANMPAGAQQNAMLSNGSMMGGHMNQSMNQQIGGQNMVGGKNQMVNQQNFAMMKTTKDVPFTAAVSSDMPPAFQEHQGEFKKANPALDLYYGRNQQMLKMSYPLGSNSHNVMAIEPPTFAFMPGQKFYDERFDRRNPAIQRQMVLPQSYLPQSMQPAAPAPAAAPPAKKSRKESTDSVPTTSAPPTPRGNPPVYPGPPSHSIDLTSPMNMPSTSSVGMNCNPGQQQQAPMNSIAGQNNYNNQMGGPGGYPMPMQSPVNGPMKPQFMMQQQQMSGQVGNGYPPNGMINDPQRMHQMNQMNMQQQQYNQREMQRPQQPAKCVACSLPLSSAQPGFFCGAPHCQRAYHRQCTGLTPGGLEIFDSNPNAKWVCSNCQQLAPHSH